MPPFAIICIRHGERVDHARPEWSRTAERPHDAPLTNSGRAMARKAGAHIAQMLSQALERISKERQKQQQQQKQKNDDDDDDDADGDGDGDASATATGAPLPPSRENLVGETVIMSSPLIRTVQTSDEFCKGYEEAAAAVVSSQRSSDDDASTDKKTDDSQLKIHVEQVMVEGSFWANHDLHKGGYHHAAPYPADRAFHLSETELAESASPRVAVTGSGARSFEDPIRAVRHHRDAGSGGFGEHESVRDRMRAAAAKIAHGGVPFLENKVAVFVGHGETVQTLDNALRRALNVNGDGRQISADPFYTAFSIMCRVDDGGYVDLTLPMQTPHLDE